MGTRIHMNDQFILKVSPLMHRLPLIRSPAAQIQESLWSGPVVGKMQLSKRTTETRNGSVPRPRVRRVPRNLRTQSGYRVSSISETGSSQRRPRPPLSSLLTSNSFLIAPLSLDTPANRDPTQSPVKSPATRRARFSRIRYMRNKLETSPGKVIEIRQFSPLPRETEPEESGRVKWEETTRVVWRRRPACKGFPLLILNWEGVFGEWMKKTPWSLGGLDLYLRPGSDTGLLLLSQKFQIAFISSLSKPQQTSVLDVFERKNVLFDAVYKKRKNDGTSFVLDYSQILQDFGFGESADSVLVVSSIGIDQEDLVEREGLGLISEAGVSKHRRYLWAQTNFSCVSFDYVAKVIFDLKPSEDFGVSFENLSDFKVSGLKKTVLPANFLSSYREELKGLKREKTTLAEEESRFLVMCGPRFPLGTYRLQNEQNKSPYREVRSGERHLERKQSTKSVI